MKLARPLLLAGALVFVPTPAGAQDESAPPPPPPAPTPTPTPPPPPPEPTIAAGIHAGGVDLSGMTAGQAEAALAPVAEAASAPVVVVVGGKRHKLPVARVGYALDAGLTARRALRASSQPPAQGERKEVELAIKFARQPVRKFAATVAKRASVAPRNARVRIRVTSVRLRKGRPGRSVSASQLSGAIVRVLADPALGREVRPKVTRVAPKIKTKQVRRANWTVVTVDQSQFRARLFKGFKLKKRYRIATGLPGNATPNGRFSVISKQVNPTWFVPNSPWAGELAGSTVSGGSASNPLKARWIGIGGAIGFHGTGESWTIGTRASRGCLRLTVPNVIDLYRRVPMGTPVLIVP